MNALITFFVLFVSGAIAPTSPLPVEVDTRPSEKTTAPLVVLNININIGQNQISSIAATAPYMKKTKTETMSLHIMKVERHGDTLNALIENEDGTNEWQKIQIAGLKYRATDDAAWRYMEFDVFVDGKMIGKERVIAIHRKNISQIINMADGTSL